MKQNIIQLDTFRIINLLSNHNNVTKNEIKEIENIITRIKTNKIKLIDYKEYKVDISLYRNYQCILFISNLIDIKTSERFTLLKSLDYDRRDRHELVRYLLFKFNLDKYTISLLLDLPIYKINYELDFLEDI